MLSNGQGDDSAGKGACHQADDVNLVLRAMVEGENGVPWCV